MCVLYVCTVHSNIKTPRLRFDVLLDLVRVVNILYCVVSYCIVKPQDISLPNFAGGGLLTSREPRLALYFPTRNSVLRLGSSRESVRR